MGGFGSKNQNENKVPNLYDEKRRTNIAKELVETERSYVKSLQVLCEVFVKPLKDSANSTNPILTANEIKDIFGIIEVIVNFHATLLTDLDERMKKWDSTTCMGDIFAKNNAFFKMISTYVNGYNNALMIYYQCKGKNKAFCQFLDKAMASTGTMLDLQSYLIMPVQRLPRYVLLLTELVKYSNPRHPGYQSLSDSLEGVKKVADFVNEEKKNAESSLKMLQIQENLVGKRARPILEPTRKYYGEGTFTWVNSRRKEPRPLQYFLFSDCIMLATPEKGFFQSTPDKYKLKIMEPLVSVDIQEDGEPQGSEKKFDIRTTHKVFTVHFNPEVDMDEWIEIFYWIRSGCGPRYEKVNAEAQKRHFTRAETIEHISQKKLNTKSDPQANKLKNSAEQPLASKSTISPPPPSQPAKSPPPAQSSPKLSPSPAPSSPKLPPGPSSPPAKAPPSNPPSSPKGPPPSTSDKQDSKKSPEPTRKQDGKEKGPEPPKQQDSKDKNPEPAKQQNNKGKSPEPAKKSDTKEKTPELSAKQTNNGKAPEQAKPDAKPPRPAGPPPPKKEAATAKNEAASAASQPLERRPSFTASFSAFFGGKPDAPTTSNAAPPANSPASPRGAKPSATPPANSPASPRGAKPPPTAPAKK